MKKIKSVTFALILCLIAFVFGGCGATVNVAVSEYTSKDNLYTVEIKMPTSLEKELISENKNRSVEKYLNALSNQCGLDATVTRIAKNGEVSFSIIFYASTNFLTENNTEGHSVTKTDGFFFDTYTFRMKNPLERLADIATNGNSVTTTNTAEYVAYVIANGKNSLLPIDEYFSIDGVRGKDIALYYLFQRRNLMQSDAQVALYNANDYYVFSTSLKEDGKEVVYSRKTPNSVAWYGLCITIGFIVTGLILLVTIKGKKKGVVVDKTVYEQKRLAYRKTRNANARIVPIKRETPDVYGYKEKPREKEREENETLAVDNKAEYEDNMFGIEDKNTDND